MLYEKLKIKKIFGLIKTKIILKINLPKIRLF